MTLVGRIVIGGDWSVAPKPKRTGVESQPATRDGHERTFFTVRGFSIFFPSCFIFRSISRQRVSYIVRKRASDIDVSLYLVIIHFRKCFWLCVHCVAQCVLSTWIIAGRSNSCLYCEYTFYTKTFWKSSSSVLIHTALVYDLCEFINIRDIQSLVGAMRI